MFNVNLSFKYFPIVVWVTVWSFKISLPVGGKNKFVEKWSWKNPQVSDDRQLDIVLPFLNCVFLQIH